MWTRRTSRGRRDLPLSCSDVPGMWGGCVVDVVGAVAGTAADAWDVGAVAEGAATPLVAPDVSAGGVRG